MDNIAINSMLEQGQLQPVDAASVDAFLRGDELKVLFFAGDQRRRGDAHDVAVALREILKDYGGQVAAALVEQSAENALQPRFRVLVSPSLVLAYRGETLEVIPRVRDWSDYARAFQRYLGSPGGAVAQEH